MTASVVAKLSIFRNVVGTGNQVYWATVGQVVAGLAAFLTSVLLIREVGLLEFGRFSVAALIIIIVKNFAEGLLLGPFASIGPKLNQFAIIPYRGFVLINAVVFFVLTSVLICAGLFVASWISTADWLYAIAVPVAFASATSGLSDFFRRQQFLIGAPSRSFGLEALRYSVQLMLLVGMISFTPNNLSAITAIYITALSALCSAVLGFVFFGTWTSRRKMNRAGLHRHWKYARWMIPSVGFETVQTMFPFLYASAILGEASLGLLRAAHQITSLLNLPFNALMQVIPGVAAAKFAREGMIAVRKFLRSVGGVMAVASGALGLLVLLSANQVSAMLGITETEKLKILLLLFIVVNIINALRFSTMVLVNTSEKTSVNLIASFAGAIISIILSISIVYIFKDNAVVFTFIAVSLTNWLVLYFWHKIYFNNY